MLGFECLLSFYYCLIGAKESMLYSLDEIEALVADIEASSNNTIVFVMGHPGLDKTRIFRKAAKRNASNTSRIRTNGKGIKHADSSMQRCFIDAILTYIKLNNTVKTRSHLVKELKKRGIQIHASDDFLHHKKFNDANICNAIRRLSYLELWEVYRKIAGKTPLSLFVIEPSIEEKEKSFLSRLANCAYGQGLSLFIGTRPNEENLHTIQAVLELNEACLIAPLLPEVQKNSLSKKTDTKSITISIKGVGPHESADGLIGALSHHNCYRELLRTPRRIVDRLDNPIYLFLLGRQEVTLRSVEYLEKCIRQSDGSHLVACVTNHGYEFFVDSIAYYLTLSLYEIEVRQKTQSFFLSIMMSCEQYVVRRIGYKPYLRFLAEAGKKQPNVLSKRYPEYFAGFAKTTRLFLKDSKAGPNSAINHIKATETLKRYVSDYNEQLLQALAHVYRASAVLGVLEYGLERIKNALDDHQLTIEDNELPVAECNFIKLCLVEAYRWLDTTLVDSIIDVVQVALSYDARVRIGPPDYVMLDEGKTCISEYIAKGLRRLRMSIGDSIDRATVFLSYNHEDSIIADVIDRTLSELGYLVRRDCRDVELWGELQEFMKSIGDQDYIVPVMSDAFLHSEGCVFELTWLIKNRTYSERTFPIAISCPKDSGKDMFSFDYRIEIVKYWEDMAKSYNDQIRDIAIENIAGLAEKYRDVKNMAQTADVFLQEFLGKRLIGVVDCEQENALEKAEELVHKIDMRILGM